MTTHNTHRGALAGLSEEEREKAIDAYFDEEDAGAGVDDPFGDLLETLVSFSHEANPKRGLRELLALMDKDAVINLALDLEIDNAELLGHATLLNRLAVALQDPQKLEVAAGIIASRGIDNFLEVAQRGGTLMVPDSKASFETIFPPIEPFVFLFHKQGGFTYVVPAELTEPIKQLDWQKLRAEAALADEIRLMAGAAVELRGIVPLIEFLDDCRSRHPELDDEESLVMDVMRGAFTSPFYVVLIDEDDIFLLEPDLADAYLADPDTDARFLPDSPLLQGELGQALQSLLDDQAGKDPRPIPDEMLDHPLAPIWREKLPAARELRNWFDAHVPEGQNDYTFGNIMIRTFINEARWGDTGMQAIKRYIDITKSMGLELDDNLFDEFLAKLQSFVNQQPIWPNNGWSPEDLHAR